MMFRMSLRENQQMINALLLLLLSPLILGIFFLPSNSSAVYILIATWILDIFFIFHGLFFPSRNIRMIETCPNIFPKDSTTLKGWDTGSKSGVERKSLLVISVLIAIWITVQPIISIILVLIFIALSYVYEMVFPMKDNLGNIVCFDKLRVEVLLILDLAFLAVIVTIGYWTTNPRFMWFLTSLWFITIFTHFNMIKKEKGPQLDLYKCAQIALS